MAITLYPFQVRGLAEGRAAYRRPLLDDRGRPIVGADGKPEVVRAVLFVGPTGMGKTTLAAEASLGASRRGRRVVAIAHRQELITQMGNRILAHCHGQGHQVRVGIGGSDNAAPIQVTSIQTILASRRMPPGDLVLVDEAHHYVADSWLMPVQTYLAQGANIMGLTATPMRDDQRAMGRADGGVFDYLVTVAQVSELVELNAREPDKGITPIDCRSYPLNRNLAQWPERAYLSMARDRSCVVFAEDVKKAGEIAERFARECVSVGVVHGKTKASEREATLSAFAKGEIKVLVNVNVLTEGWDAPICDVVILARKVGSLSLLIQMIGRGRRPMFAGKTCLLIDLCGNLHTHNFHPDDELEYSLEGEPVRVKDAIGGRVPRVCKHCKRVLDDDLAAARAAGVELTHCPECKRPLSKVRGLTSEEVELERFERDRARADTPPSKMAKALCSLYLKGLRAGWKRGSAEQAFKRMFSRYPDTDMRVVAWREANAIVDREKGDAWAPPEGTGDEDRSR